MKRQIVISCVVAVAVLFGCGAIAFAQTQEGRGRHHKGQHGATERAMHQPDRGSQDQSFDAGGRWGDQAQCVQGKGYVGGPQHAKRDRVKQGGRHGRRSSHERAKSASNSQHRSPKHRRFSR